MAEAEGQAKKEEIGSWKRNGETRERERNVRKERVRKVHDRRGKKSKR